MAAKSDLRRPTPEPIGAACERRHRSYADRVDSSQTGRLRMRASPVGARGLVAGRPVKRHGHDLSSFPLPSPFGVVCFSGCCLLVVSFFSCVVVVCCCLLLLFFFWVCKLFVLLLCCGERSLAIIYDVSTGPGATKHSRTEWTSSIRDGPCGLKPASISVSGAAFATPRRSVSERRSGCAGHHRASTPVYDRIGAGNSTTPVFDPRA